MCPTAQIKKKILKIILKVDNNDNMNDNRVNTPKKVLKKVTNGCLQKIMVLVYLPNLSGYSNLYAALGGIKE